MDNILIRCVVLALQLWNEMSENYTAELKKHISANTLCYYFLLLPGTVTLVKVHDCPTKFCKQQEL